ncbi:MAG: hypothetical protein IPK71_31550 [Myxococcales bacterium]|nr:hypothetical protein [Myxococcales bacterium]
MVEARRAPRRAKARRTERPRTIRRARAPTSAPSQTRSASRQVDRASRQVDRASRQVDRASRQADRASRQADRASRQADRASRQVDRASRQADRASRRTLVREKALAGLAAAHRAAPPLVARRSSPGCGPRAAPAKARHSAARGSLAPRLPWIPRDSGRPPASDRSPDRPRKARAPASREPRGGPPATAWIRKGNAGALRPAPGRARRLARAVEKADPRPEAVLEALAPRPFAPRGTAWARSPKGRCAGSTPRARAPRTLLPGGPPRGDAARPRPRAKRVHSAHFGSAGGAHPAGSSWRRFVSRAPWWPRTERRERGARGAGARRVEELGCRRARGDPRGCRRA